MTTPHPPISDAQPIVGGGEVGGGRTFLKAALYLVVVAGAALIGVHHFSPPVSVDPRFQGKPVTEWLKETASRDTVTATTASLVVKQIGSAAVPTLIKLLKAKDLPFVNAIKQRGINKGYTDINGTWAPHEAAFRHDLADKGFAVLGPLAKGAVPELIKELADTDSEVRNNAVKALWRIGSASEAALPDLFRALKDNMAFIQFNAASAIMHISPDEGRRLGVAAALAKAQQNPNDRSVTADLRRIGSSVPNVPEKREKKP